MPVMFDACLILWAKISTPSRNASGEKGQPCLIPHSTGKNKYFVFLSPSSIHFILALVWASCDVHKLRANLVLSVFHLI